MNPRSLFLTCVLTVAGMSAHAVTWNGNGTNDFGGAVGQGSLTFTDNGTTVSGTLTRGPGNLNDVLVLYLDAGAGGFTNTAGFSDAGDGLRKAISGFNGGTNASDRSVLTFANGFTPEFALALGPFSDNFGGLWSLADGGNNSLGFVSGANLAPTGNNTAASYTFQFDLASLGLTPGAGQSFQVFGTYISNTGYRSQEGVPGNLTGVTGYNAFLQLASETYTSSVPEPSVLLLLGAGAAACGATVRRRR